MMAEHLEILVEEPSMEAFLRALLPRMLGDAASFNVYPYQCKVDLLAKLPARLRGYASWLPQTWRIVVVVDRDDDDCVALKQRMEQMTADVGLCNLAGGKSHRDRRIGGLVFRRLGGGAGGLSASERHGSPQGKLSRS